MNTTPNCFRDGFFYKFVIFDDGNILFCDIMTNHSDLARTYKGRPIGAGKIKYRKGEYQIEERGSFTLGLSGIREPKKLKIYLENNGITECQEYI